MKLILAQPKAEQKRIFQAIYNLPIGDVKRLQGTDGIYRLRVGEYRILYSIYNKVAEIIIINAGNRGQIYKK